MLIDAHNHLQDPRLTPCRGEIEAEIQRLGIQKMVVNGTAEADWETVIELAERHDWIVSSLGLHPWFIRERGAQWLERLKALLDRRPCGLGEIGLDRWMENPDLPAQEEVFLAQLRLAADRNLPASIHCLKNWGRLHELLEAGPRPECGFLLHSYNGPVEMVPRFAALGAFFSISGYFAHERKEKQRDCFRAVPRDRILVETDAPDMRPPDSLDRYQLHSDDEALNHPGNLPAVYRFAAQLFEQPLDEFQKTVEANFRRLFGGLLD